MELLTPELRAALPPLYSQGRAEDPLCVVKFFTPDANWTWYAIECGDSYGDTLFFGLVQGLEEELGYFTLAELQRVRGGLGLPVERDLHFTPKPLSQVRRR